MPTSTVLFYTPDSSSLNSTQNQNLWGYNATTSLSSTTVANSNGSVTAPTISAATSNVNTVTASSSTNGTATTTITTVPPGYLMVNGYGYSTSTGNQITPFANGVQVLDMTACATNKATLTVYPNSSTAGTPIGSQAYGYLTCQSPPTLPYNACTSDTQATGGVIAAIMTTATASDGSGAQFQLGCACIPSYLGGPSSGTNLGGVIVGATSVNPTGSCN
jgi:hypothetical protein